MRRSGIFGRLRTFLSWELFALILMNLSAYTVQGADVLKSLSMKGAAELAVATSAELRGMETQQILKEGAWAAGFRAFLPKLSLSASEDDRLSQNSTDSFSKTYTVSLTQLIWDGGRLSASRMLEKTELDLARSDLLRTAAEIGEGAINLYRTVMYKRAVYDIRRKSYEALEIQRAILDEEVRRGLALQTDLEEADLSLEQNRLDMAMLCLELDEAEQELALRLGVERLPILSDPIDPERISSIPAENAEALIAAVQQTAAELYPDIVKARYGIRKLVVQLENARKAWLPAIKLNGDFSLSGNRYPLTRYSYSVSLVLEFSHPLLSGSLTGLAGASKAGWEGQADRNARLQSAAEPLRDPASMFSVRSLEASLELEQSRLTLLSRQLEQQARRLVQSCVVAEQKRRIALGKLVLSQKQLELAKLKHSLGQMTSLDIMKARIGLSQEEIGLVEAAVGVLEAERNLEKLLDLEPGSLASSIADFKAAFLKNENTVKE